MKAKRWYIKFPLDVYAMGPVEFENSVGEKEVRKYARKWEGVKRLPMGFQCWPAADEPRPAIFVKSQRIVCNNLLG